MNDAMRQQLTQRIAELKAQQAAGQQQADALEARLRSLQTTLLQITGAIQVLEEQMASDPPE